MRGVDAVGRARKVGWTRLRNDIFANVESLEMEDI